MNLVGERQYLDTEDKRIRAIELPWGADPVNTQGSQLENPRGLYSVRGGK